MFKRFRNKIHLKIQRVGSKKPTSNGLNRLTAHLCFKCKQNYSISIVFNVLGVATKVYVIDVPRADIIDGPISVRGYLSQTVREFKQKLSQIVNIDPTEMKLVAMILSQYRLLQDDETLQAEGFAVYNVHKLYVCSNFNTEITNPPKNTSNKFPNSILFSMIESFEKLIWCYVHLPEVGKDNLVKGNLIKLKLLIKYKISLNLFLLFITLNKILLL